MQPSLQSFITALLRLSYGFARNGQIGTRADVEHEQLAIAEQ